MLNLNDPEFLANRRESYRHLRKNEPIAVTELNGEKTVVLTRNEDAFFVLRQATAVVQPALDEYPAYLGNGPASVYYRYNVASVDSPYHTKLRRILVPLFTPQAVLRMESWINEIIKFRLDEVQEFPEINFVYQLSMAVPVDVACKVVGISRAEADYLLSFIHEMTAILSQEELSTEDLKRSDHATQAYFDLFNKHLNVPGEHPENSLSSTVLQAEKAGLLTRDDSLSAMIAVFIASIHTTMSSLSNAISALGHHPDQRAALAEDPTLFTAAWEEVMRYDSPVHFRHRYVREPLMIRDHRIDPGVKVMIALASANWDEEAFDAPDVFNIARGAARNFAFGGGSHFCLGAQLGRLEGRLFLAQFLARFPDYQLADKPVARNHNLTFPHIESMYVNLNGKH